MDGGLMIDQAVAILKLSTRQVDRLLKASVNLQATQ